MKNDFGPEDMVGSTEEFRRYLAAGGKFFEAFSNLRSEVETYVNGWEEIDERVAGALVCSFAEEFERLAGSLKEVTSGVMEINGRLDELNKPTN